MVRYPALVCLLVIPLLPPVQGQNSSRQLREASQGAVTSPQQSRPRNSRNTRPDNLSPYDIARYINENEDADIRQVWRWLKLNITYTDLSYKCHGSCEGETFVINLSGEKAIVAKISYTGGNYYQYLIFKKTTDKGGRWKFLGFVDSSYQQYGSPEHRVERRDGKTWLVIQELWGRGSCFGIRGERWFEIEDRQINEDGEIKEALAYPVSGLRCPFNEDVGRETESEVLFDADVLKGPCTVKVQFSVSYKFGDEPGQRLFSKEQVGYFVFDSETGRFALDKSRSQISEDEIQKVHNYDSLDDEHFIQYNYEELLGIANNGTERQKSWLSKFLDKVADTPQKLSLQQALQQ